MTLGLLSKLAAGGFMLAQAVSPTSASLMGTWIPRDDPKHPPLIFMEQEMILTPTTYKVEGYVVNGDSIEIDLQDHLKLQAQFQDMNTIALTNPRVPDAPGLVLIRQNNTQ